MRHKMPQNHTITLTSQRIIWPRFHIISLLWKVKWQEMFKVSLMNAQNTNQCSQVLNKANMAAITSLDFRPLKKDKRTARHYCQNSALETKIYKIFRRSSTTAVISSRFRKTKPSRWSKWNSSKSFSQMATTEKHLSDSGKFKPPKVSTDY